MSKRSDENLRGIPTKPYDMLREGLLVLAAVTIAIVLLAALWGTPDYPTVTAAEVAAKQPIPFLKLAVSYLSGENDLQTYGPPYTNDPANAQAAFGFLSPQRWVGTINPVNAQVDLALKPLQRIGMLNPEVAKALDAFTQASDEQQKAWTKDYSDALDKASAADGKLVLPAGDYGPVPTLMDGMLNLARAGLLEGALDSSASLPYSLNNTKSLLFLQGDIENTIAGHLNQQGGQWGMSNEMGPYPGAWWMWPYAFLYQIPVIANSANADLIAGLIMGFVFLILLFLPVIPILNRIPRWIPVYRLIWRDWYDRQRPDSK